MITNLSVAKSIGISLLLSLCLVTKVTPKGTNSGFSAATSDPSHAPVPDLFDNEAKSEHKAKTELVIVDGLVAYYPMDSNGQDSLEQNNGTIQGFSSTSNRFGNPNEALAIVEKTDYMEITPINSVDLTVSFWYQYEPSDTWNTLLCRNGGSFHHLLINYQGTAKHEIGFWRQGWNGSGYKFTPGSWYYITLIKEGTRSRIYIADSLIMDSNSSFSNASYPLGVIGNYTTNNPSQGALGKLDEIRIYDRALTEQEISILYDDGGYADLDAAMINIDPEEVRIVEEGSRPVTCTLQNVGQQTLTNGTVAWEVNGAAQTPVTFSGESLELLDSLIIPLGNYHFVPEQSHSIRAWLSDVNGGADDNFLNDTTGVERVFVNPAETHYAFEFDGANDYIDLEGVGEEIAGSNEATFEMWFKAPPQGTNFLFSVNPNNTSNQHVIMLGINSGGQIIAYDGSSNSSEILTDRRYDDEAYHHIAYTKVANIGSLYIDGRMMGTHDAGYTFQADDKYSIGQEYDGINTPSQFFEGIIDEVRIWKVARTEEQIREWMVRNNGLAEEEGLVAAYHFGESVNQQTLDLTGGYPGTLINTPMHVLSGAPIADNRPLNDAGITAIILPDSLPAGNQAVSAVIYNYGQANLQQASIRWSVNGQIQQPYSWTGDLPTNTPDTISIGTYNFQDATSYQLSAWTVQPNGVVDLKPQNDTTITKDIIYARLAGNYTIGGADPNFPNLTKAVEALNIGGISAPVTFNIRPGTYEEQLVIEDFSGSDCSRPVIFQSETLDSTDVLLQLAASYTLNYMIRIEGADGIVFQHLSFKTLNHPYNRVIDFRGGADCFQFLRNYCSAPTSTGSANDKALIFSPSVTPTNDHVTIKDNTFYGGSHAIQLLGTAGDRTEGALIENNQMINQSYRGVDIRQLSNPKILHNLIRNDINRADFAGIALYRIHDSYDIISNRVIIDRVAKGLFLQESYGTTDRWGLISNNAISLGGGTSASIGIHLDIEVYKCNVFHNTVFLHSSNSGSSVMYFDNHVYGGDYVLDLNLNNNNLVNTAGGPVLQVDNNYSINGSFISNNNNLYTTGSKLIGIGGSFATLADWQSSTGQDANSVSLDPQFFSEEDLRIARPELHNTGTPLAEVPTDITGADRDLTNPDIGAYEFDLFPNDIGVDQILHPPVAGCDLPLTDTVRVRIINYGSAPQSNFPVSYSVGGSTVTEIVAETLNSGQTYDYTFTQELTLPAFGTYTMDAYTGLNGDENTDNDLVSVSITNLGPISAAISGDPSICRGSAATLTASGNGSYRWSTGATAQTIAVNPTTTSTYSLTVTDSNGCTETVSHEVEVRTPATPQISIDGSLSLCPGDTVRLISDIEESIQWSNGLISPVITVTEPGTFSLTHFAADGCTAKSESVTVDNSMPLTIDSDGVGTICEGDEETLSVSGAISLEWSTGAVTNSITVSPNNTTSYAVTATNSDGCIYTDSFELIVIPAAIPGVVSNMYPPDGTVDLPPPVQFSWAPAPNASHYDLYIWPSGTATPSSPTVANISGISYRYGGILSYGLSYDWQVVAKNSCLEGAAGPIQSFSTRELSDLVATNIQVPSGIVFSGRELTIDWTILNNGLGTTGNRSWYEQLYLSEDQTLEVNKDRYLGARSNPTSLQSGENYSNSATFQLPEGIEGLYYLILRTDPYQKISESDESNNQSVSPSPINIQLTPPPDLSVSQILPPGVDDVVLANSEEDMGWTVINQGTGPTVSGGWYDNIYISPNANLEQLNDGSTGINFGEAHFLGRLYHEGNLQVNEQYSRSSTVTIPDLSGGEYYLYIYTDRHQREYEHQYEYNNITRYGPITVVATPRPDLIIETINVQSSADNRESIAISWQGRNNGAPLSGNWSDRLYLSDTPDLSGAYVQNLGTKHQSRSLNTNEIYNDSRSLSIPAVISGNYYLVVEANTISGYQQGLDAETDLTNNLNAVPILIQAPDLAPSAVNLPSTAVSGNTIALSWLVTNHGPGKLLGGLLKEAFYLSTDPIFDAGVDLSIGSYSGSLTLAENQPIGRQATITVPKDVSGSYYLIVVTNPDELIFENGQSGNNVAASASTINISLADYPDLEGVALTPEMTEITAGQSLSVDFSVRNSGSGRALGNWEDQIHLSSDPNWDGSGGQLLGSRSHSQLMNAASEYDKTISINIPTHQPAGTYYLFLHTDAEHQLYEHTAENNNTYRSAAITIAAFPNDRIDLAINNINTPAVIVPGEAFGISWMVSNIGNSITRATSWIDALYISGNAVWDAGDLLLKQWSRDGALEANQSYARLETLVIPEEYIGEYYLILVTDAEQLTLDGNRSNNQQALAPAGGNPPVTITFPDPPDLETGPLQVSGDIQAGARLQLIYTVGNSGSGALNDTDWADALWLSDDQKIDRSDIRLARHLQSRTLPSGASYTDTLDLTLPSDLSGNYYFLLRTDDVQNIRNELSEENNTSSSFAFIAPIEPSDLVVTEVTHPGSAQLGSEITVNWAIENQGGFPAVGRILEGVYLSRDEIWDAEDILLGQRNSDVDLAPGATHLQSLSGVLDKVAMTDYFILVKTDLANQIPEDREDNNVGYGAVPLSADVPELPIGILTPADLAENSTLLYRIEVPANLQGEVLRVSLSNGSEGAINQLYLRKGDVPTAANYDYTVTSAFTQNPTFDVPSLENGTYYLLVENDASPGSIQNIELLAELLTFGVEVVQTDKGGNTGQVTVQVSGSQFKTGMMVALQRGGNTINGTNIKVNSATKAYVTFNLTGASPGQYDLIAEDGLENSDMLTNGFEVVSGSGSDTPVVLSCSIDGGPFGSYLKDGDPLDFDIQHPFAVRALQPVVITFRLENKGYVDIPIPKRRIVSMSGAPLSDSPITAFIAEVVSELILEFLEDDGPGDVLRPGAVIYKKVYSRAEEALRFRVYY